MLLALNVTHPDLIIRQGLPTDAENLAALSIQVFLHTYATEGISSPIAGYALSEFSTKGFVDLLKDSSTTVFVAETNANLIGYARVSVQNPCPHRAGCIAELVTLYVQEHFTSKGVGSRLLACCEELAMERTRHPLWLSVNAKNTDAVAFYARHRYSNLGISQFRLGGEDHENYVLVAGLA